MSEATETQIPEFKFKGQNLSEIDSKSLTMMLIATDKNEVEMPLDKDPDFSGDFPSQIFLKRINAYELPFSVSNLFFAISLKTWADNPGKVMMLLRLVYQEWKRTGQTYFTLSDWAEKFFPFGTPSDNEQEQWWNSQKNENEPLKNMVDNQKYWK